jgi:SAM-dependent methyltransferase
VIEHGVELKAYFREMNRIIRPGGILIISTDYYDAPIDTSGRIAYGTPIHVFTKEEIAQTLDLARSSGFTLISPLDLTAGEKVVHWKEHDLHYSFVIFSLQRTT